MLCHKCTSPWIRRYVEDKLYHADQLVCFVLSVRLQAETPNNFHGRSETIRYQPILPPDNPYSADSCPTFILSPLILSFLDHM